VEEGGVAGLLAGGMYAAPTGEMRLFSVGAGLIPPSCCSSMLLQLEGNRRRCVAAKEGVAAVQLEGGVNPAPTMAGVVGWRGEGGGAAVQLAGGMYAAPPGGMRLFSVGAAYMPPACSSLTLPQPEGN